MGANRWPKSYGDRIAFIEQRIAAWVAQAESIGLSDDETSQLAGLLSPARNKHTAAVAARSASKNATGEFYSAAEPFSALAGALIRKIRSFAQASDDPSVYALASIDPVAQPTPAPPPEMPGSLDTSLRNDGAVKLKWKSKSPRGLGGVVFEVQRRLSTQATYRVLSATTEKKFIDETLPPGTPWASYRIIARRAGKASDFSEPVIVYLGVPTEGEGEGEGGLGLAA